MPTLPPVRQVRFDVRPWDDDEPDSVRELLPYVDDVSLVELVSGYEHTARYDVPGAYAGIVLHHVNVGDLTAYLTGAPPSACRGNDGVIALLGCDCGEVGCWPLEARVVVDDDLVTWRDFTQPFHPKRDYRAFGPLVFHRGQYEQAVREAVATLVSALG